MKLNLRSPDLGLFLIRFGAGFMLAFFHGWDKFKATFGYIFQGQEWGMVKGVGDLGFPLPGFFAVCAALAEFVGASLLAVGLFTNYASAFVGFTMLVAIYSHLQRGDWRIELAAIYLLTAVAFILMSPGKYSLDWLLRKKA